MSEATEIVAIDGPSGVGKSSVAREVARRLGYAFLDTGAMYRAATWWAMRRGVDWNDAPALIAATRALPLEMSDDGAGGSRVLVDGEDITEAIRGQDVTRNIHKLDQVPEVREHLVALQRAIGERQPTVAEGRDIGTVVFPRARCKVFVEANLDARAQRRKDEMAGRGVDVDYETLRTELHERDERARTRTVSPLRRAEDAVLVDTTNMGFEDVVEAILDLVRATQ